MTVVLTADQQRAYTALIDLMTSKTQDILVIQGGAGTGKSTLVKTFVEEWQSICKLSGGAFPEVPIYLTATTNKAADALAMATSMEVTTIHKLLGLRVHNTGYKESTIVDAGFSMAETGSAIVVDESSFIGENLWKQIKRKAQNCKLIFIGDPCQLPPVNDGDSVIFNNNLPTVYLNQIVRQADDSPVQRLSRALREFVMGQPIQSAGVDGVNILHYQQQEFEQALVNEFKQYPDASIRALTWTNDKALYYNALVAEALTGSAHFRIGDQLTVNKQIKFRDQWKLATDSSIEVSDISEPWIDGNGVECLTVVTAQGQRLRYPIRMGDAESVIKQAYESGDQDKGAFLENLYADLRLMFACTVNKSQGSTYDTVFVDLQNIGKCRDKASVSRMLYVAASRARSKVVFTGDI